MTWVRRYRAKLYLKNSMWVLPALGIVLGWLTVASLAHFERTMGWELQISKDNALAVMGVVAASTFNLVVVVTSALLLAVQLASAQLTPRVMVFAFRSPVRKVLLAVFAFTFTSSVSFLLRIETSVPFFTAYLVSYGFLLNLALFLYFVDSLAKSLRPSSVLRSVALAGREVIREVYPRQLAEKEEVLLELSTLLQQQPTITVVNLIDGALLAFDLKGLFLLAQRSKSLIQLVPEVGDYVAFGDPLFRVYGGERLSVSMLRHSVAIGPERTVEQDPMFAFRIIVDIATKAVSPAINDPTTAVLAIDQIHHLLRDVGNRCLADGREKDSSGRLCVVYSTPDWEDFVRLSITEIRQYGATSLQVTRRLRAVLENLIETLPHERTPMLRRELSLLDTSAQRTFPDPHDQTLAEGSDRQGIGGSRESPELHSVGL